MMLAITMTMVSTLLGADAGEPEMRLIFPPQEKHVHASSVVELADGRLLACWFHGSGERKADDVVVQGAAWRPGNEAWGPVHLYADTPGYPDCNPVMFLDREGELCLFRTTVLGQRWMHSLIQVVRGTPPVNDEAPAWRWQELVMLDPGESFPDLLKKRFDELEIQEELYADHAPRYTEMLIEAAGERVKRQMGWMTRIHPLVLPSGRILLPCYSDGFNVGLVGISDDNGATWRTSEAIVGMGSIQPSLVRHRDGSLSAFLRDNGPAPQRVLVSHSTDEGETWSAARDTSMPNPGSSVDVISLASGAWLFVGNDTEEGRRHITAYLSDDEGATWSVGRILESGEGEYSYPSVIQSRDGRIHALFTHRDAEGASIRHMVLTEDWVRAGTLTGPGE